MKWSDSLSGIHQWHWFCHSGTFLPTGTFFLHIQFLQIVLTFFCNSQRVLPLLTTKIEWQHIVQQGCNWKVELMCLHYDCTSFDTCNGYPMTCLDSTYSKHVVCKSTVWQITKILHAHRLYFLNSLCNIIEWNKACSNTMLKNEDMLLISK
jgi:hypothetical protein